MPDIPDCPPPRRRKQDPKPALKVVSFGAGIQSMTKALLIRDGKLEKPDAVIFSDTGWEPAAVYAALDRVEREIFKPLGIPLYRVNNGVIQRDVLDPNQMRTLPAFTASKPYEVKVIDHWGLCPDRACGWRSLRQVRNPGMRGDEEPALFDVPAENLGDMQGLFDSLLLVPRMATLTQIDRLANDDFIAEIEDSAAEQVARAMRLAALKQLPAPHELCKSSGRIVTASHTEIRRDFGKLNRKCTQQYKLRPILEQVRLLLGAQVGEETICRYCNGEGERVAPWRAKRGETEIGPCSVCEGLGTISRVGPPPEGAWVEQWIGFSTDEITRVSNRGDTYYSKSRYPLLELDMSRQQCIDYLTANGWGDVAKSACLGCPFKSNAEWRRLRDTDPQAWAEVVAFDKAYRDGAGMNQQRFLHPSCLPLDEAPIDKRQPREWKPSTVSDQVYAAQLARAEEGDPDGCSPWACRSGEPVDIEIEPLGGVA